MEWSADVDRAAWIGPRLTPFGSGVATSVVPGGFEAYVRLLHKAEAPDTEDYEPTVRWDEIAAWSGLPLEPYTQFHEIALPEHDPGPPPWDGAGPQEGSLTARDAGALVEILRNHTETPRACWFCYWDGLGGYWDDRYPRTPRVQLPNRTYVLGYGAVDDALAYVREEEGQTPNLWWPEDRSWCVASEIDLDCTYVGGSRELVDQVLSDPELEAQPIDPEGTSHHQRVPAWVEQALESMADELLSSGAARLETVHGTFSATLLHPGLLRRRAWLRTQWDRDSGGNSSSTGELRARSGSKLRAEVLSELAASVVNELAH